MSSPPVSRSLSSVLRQALDTGDRLELQLGTFGPADPSNAYCNVVIRGQTLRVPMASGVNDAQGGAAYLLVTKDLILCIASVRP